MTLQRVQERHKVGSFIVRENKAEMKFVVTDQGLGISVWTIRTMPFVWLEKAYQERSNFLACLKVVPFADPLRADPRFNKLVSRVGLLH